MYYRKEQQYFDTAFKKATSLSKFRDVLKGKERPCTVWAQKVGLGYKNKNIIFFKNSASSKKISSSIY